MAKRFLGFSIKAFFCIPKNDAIFVRSSNVDKGKLFHKIASNIEKTHLKNLCITVMLWSSQNDLKSSKNIAKSKEMG